MKVIKTCLRLAKPNNRLHLDRDIIGAINIGFKTPTQVGGTWCFPRLGACSAGEANELASRAKNIVSGKRVKADTTQH